MDLHQKPFRYLYAHGALRCITHQQRGIIRGQSSRCTTPSICFCCQAKLWLSISHDAIVNGVILPTLHTLTAITSTFCFSCRGLPSLSYNTCQLKRGCWDGYSPPIRTSVRILIWQDYKHGYTCTARTTSRTLARDIRIRSPLRPFDFGDTFDSHSTLHDAGMFRHNRTDTELHDDDIFPVVSSHIQIPKVKPTGCLFAPPQRECCANRTRILLVFLS